MDYTAIGSALAARFTGIGPPTGESALVDSTASLPPQLGSTPIILVWPPAHETFAWGPSRWKWQTQEWTVGLYVDKQGDLPVRLARMQAWRPYLVARIVGQIQLGLSYVDWAELRSMDLGVADYGGTEYDVLTLGVVVQVRETVAAAA